MGTKTSTKFGIYGGQFIPETMMPAIEELTANLPPYYENMKTKQSLIDAR